MAISDPCVDTAVDRKSPWWARRVSHRLLTSRFGRNLSALVGARLITILAGLATLGYAARTLGPNLYGNCAFAAAVAAYASALFPGLATWGTRTIARNRHDAGLTLTVVNLTQFVFAAAVYLGIAAFAVGGISDPVLRDLLLQRLGAVCQRMERRLGVRGAGKDVGQRMDRGGVCGHGGGPAGTDRGPSDAAVYAALPAAFGLLGAIAGNFVLWRLRSAIARPSWAALARARSTRCH